MNQYDPTFDLKINVTYIPWSSDFALYHEDYLMYEQYYLGLSVSMTQSLTYISWSRILPYIFKTIWCMYIIFWEYESVQPDIWSKN